MRRQGWIQNLQAFRHCGPLEKNGKEVKHMAKKAKKATKKKARKTTKKKAKRKTAKKKAKK
jgi:hypothetical protein